MKENSILKEKMNKTAKIIITILSVLLVASMTLNVLSLFGCYPKNWVIEKNGDSSELLHKSDSLNYCPIDTKGF